MPAIFQRALAAIANRRKSLAWTLAAILVAAALAVLLLKFPSLRFPATLVSTGIFLILLLWLFPKWQARSIANSDLKPEERFDRENEARKTLSQIIGGLVLLVGFYFTWQNLQLTRDNLRATERIASEGQFTDRFTRAITQLGDTKLEIRLGGIYALERIAKDSPKDHWPIMEVLTAYLREHTKLDTSKTSSSRTQSALLNPGSNAQAISAEIQSNKPAPDIQAILTVIGRRTLTYGNGEDRPLDLHGLDLRGADLRGANLSAANLEDSNLRLADLRASYLEGANLIGVDLRFANLRGGKISKAIAKGALLSPADLQGVDLSGADLAAADLTDSDLTGADLNGAQLYITTLNRVNLNGVDLSTVTSLEFRQIEPAYGNAKTKLPPDLPRPKSW